ncbi:MAG: BamA/TamA family outer membrane protein [Balneolaceae bacterium]|nr:BamA/TamA family outer membrane protein [Balneolaceae bacterium]MCH8549083.1 BamA/TamA family outer membrane protein [Balneolaceae bacterium]
MTTDAVSAQQNSRENSDDDESEEVIRNVRFTGNSNVSNRSLRTLVRTRNNREFLGIPRFTPWYYIWRVTGRGESPALLDRETVSNDMDRIRVFYENQGFFDVEVDTTIVEYRPNRFEVSFLIREGRPSSIRSVSYTGLPDLDDELVEDFFSGSLYAGSVSDDSTFSVREQYNSQKLRQEQTRIIDFLKNHGYAAAQRDSVRALVKADPDEPKQLDVLYSIRPGDFYTFGNVYITLDGPGENGDNRDTMKVEGPPYALEGYSIDMNKQESAHTQFSLLKEQLHFTPGETFDQSAYLRSINSYQNLGMMLINRFGLSEDSSLPDYSKSEIPVYFELQTLPRHSIRTEFFGMRRYGFGTGIGVNYVNNNLFGRAENFTLGVNTNLEYVTSSTLSEIAPVDEDGNRTSTGSTLFQSYEVRAEYSVPRLNFPFEFVSVYDWIESGRTRYTLSYSQSNQLLFDINSDIRFNLRYELRHSPRFQSFIDLVELDVVDTNPSTQFRNRLIEDFGENSIEFLRIEEDFRPQFSTILRYTLRAQNTNLIRRDYGYFSEYSIALAGNVPYLMDRYLVNPGEIDGSLPSPFGISTNDLAYSRFLKLTADFRRYIPMTDNSVFAFRLFGGYAHLIGETDAMPLNRRFFAGGSNDIRGWDQFLLGPGATPAGDLTRPGGDIKLAAFKEFRQIFMRNLLNANWHIAWHTDAGNVWYGPRNEFLDEDDRDILEDGRFQFDSFYNQIAVGTGLGLRLDWEFLVARFDLTMRAHDPLQGWFDDRRLYFSFGIGHSF